MSVWDDIVPEQDRQLYRRAGFGGTAGLGTKPALVIIDTVYNFVGERLLPIAESIERYPYACGEKAWSAIGHMAPLLLLARQKQVPIIYSVIDPRANLLWGAKSGRLEQAAAAQEGNDVVAEIAPASGDIVISKLAPSVFFGTPVASLLRTLGVDSILCCGCTTSGCVRASVIDAFSYGFKVAVVEECVFDRSDVCHKVNLFDMNSKYADVVSAADVKKYLSSL